VAGTGGSVQDFRTVGARSPRPYCPKILDAPERVSDSQFKVLDLIVLCDSLSYLSLVRFYCIVRLEVGGDENVLKSYAYLKRLGAE
jgi:hypothetical protein